MRFVSAFLVTGCAAVLTALTAAAPALADPPSGTTPKPTDIVGVGASADASVFDQFGVDYDAQVAAGDPRFYSWDTTNPATGSYGGTIVTKSGCKAIGRPSGSGAGVKALAATTTTSGQPCVNFARTSKDRAPHGVPVSFITLAGDAVTYATQATTNAPGSLTTAQLTAIYECKDTNWDQVGGKAGPIKAMLPEPTSGARQFFLAALGVKTPGTCVLDGRGHLQENEGVNPVLRGPDVVVPFSPGQYIAQAFYSAACLNARCTPDKAGVVCKPAAGQNLFGCDENGTMVLHEVDGLAPTTPWPLTSTSADPVLNKDFAPAFLRPLYDAVSGKPGTVPSGLAGLFGPTGWLCTDATAQTDLTHYGFEVLRAGTATTDCGGAH